MSDTQMLNVADHLKALRDQKSELQARLKEIQTELDNTEAALIQNMLDEECTSFDRNGIRFSLVISEHPGPVPELKNELYDEMKAHGFEHLFTINARTLSATVKELKANNDDVLPDWLEGLIRIYEEPSIRVAKSR